MKKVSIIIPVYNGEKYIKRCLNSIVNQTYKNIEILIINDGSTDKTVEKLEEINDERIKIFNRENKGVSKARNFGIDVCTGEYLLFCDADDWLETNLIESMMKLIVKADYDLIRFNYYVNKTEKSNYSKGMDIEIESDNKLNLNNIINGMIKAKIPSYIWTLFIKKDFIINNKLRFDEDIYIAEDKVFLLKHLLKNPKTYIENEAYYHYYYNLDSAMHKKDFKKKIDNIIKVNKKINNLLNENNEKVLIDYNIALTAYSIERFIFDIYREESKKSAIKTFEKIKNSQETKEIFENCKKENLKIFKGYNVKCINYLYNCKYDKLFRLYYFQKIKYLIRNKLIKLKTYIKEKRS